MTRSPAWACIHSGSPSAAAAHHELTRLYNPCPLDEADLVVVLGGDGFMLQSLHDHMDSGFGFFGMNRGTVGFLMNDYRPEGLEERLAQACEQIIHPLMVDCETVDGGEHSMLAINEAAVLRHSVQAANLRLLVDGEVQIERLVCDGLLVATPAGSTAYNLSAHGPVLPIGANLLAVTPISPFRPRRWRGALLPQEARVEIEVLDAEKRPVSGGADSREVPNVRRVSVTIAADQPLRMLFDPDQSLSSRVLHEQFQ